MDCKTLDKTQQDEVTSLFSSVFTSSEGEKEGGIIRNLVSKLSSGIDNQEIICFGAYAEETIIGAIFFTRFAFEEEAQVYLLAPVAVDTKHQGKGNGQALINYGLNQLKKKSVAVAVTYGDPSFYSKVGFQSLSESVIQAPFKLSIPEGWLGQSLTGDLIKTINGRPKCVKAFCDPAYW